MKSKRTYNIYSICGASKRNIKTIITLQSIIIFVTCIIAGTIAYIVLCPEFARFELAYNSRYEYYIMVSFIMILLINILSYCLAIKVTKKDDIYKVCE